MFFHKNGIQDLHVLVSKEKSTKSDITVGIMSFCNRKNSTAIQNSTIQRIK